MYTNSPPCKIVFFETKGQQERSCVQSFYICIYIYIYNFFLGVTILAFVLNHHGMDTSVVMRPYNEYRQ